jgi:pimeloyl-ACP methyl ester carboxylesterase
MTALLLTFGGILALALGGVAWELHATRRDRRRFPPPGRIVDADGCPIHLFQAGEARIGPTVVLVSDVAMPSCHLEWVRSRVSDFAKVVAFDRPGLGWSGQLPRGRMHDAATISDALHRSLEAARVPGPYVLVGVGYGALHAIVFADRYPERMAGAVLVEPQHPDGFFRLPNGARMQRRWERAAAVAPTLARLGVLHPLKALLTARARDLPPRAHAELRAFLAQVRHVTAASEEVHALLQFTFPQVRRSRGFVDLPLLVLSAGRDSNGGDRMHEELAMLSSTSRHVTVDGASHVTLVTEARHARVVTEAVRLVVDAVRHVAAPADAPPGDAPPVGASPARVAGR